MNVILLSSLLLLCSCSNYKQHTQTAAENAQNDSLSVRSSNKNLSEHELTKFMRKIPKTDIHSHISASIPVWSWEKINKPLDTSIIPDRYEGGLKDFVDVYHKLYPSAGLTLNEIKVATHDICIEASKNNVKYLEIRAKIFGRKDKPEDFVKSVVEGIDTARKELLKRNFDQKVNIIITIAKGIDYTEEQINSLNNTIYQMYKNYNTYRVVGIDVADNEKSADFKIYPIKNFIDFANKNKIPITLHAGEEKSDIMNGFHPLQSINDAIESNAVRLGHATHLLEDEGLTKVALEKDICIEYCPSSNFATYAVKSWQKMPIKEMLDNGFRVSVNTDDAVMFKTNPTDEFIKLYKNGIITKWSDIRKLVLNGIKCSFTDPKTKQELYKNYTKELDELEKKYSNLIEYYLK